MRDGLSLLDQAIAYSAGNVTLESVREMLGTIDSTTLIRLLGALANHGASRSRSKHSKSRLLKRNLFFL